MSLIKSNKRYFPLKGAWGVSSRASHMLIALLWAFLFTACNAENAPDCFQNEGKKVRYEVTVPAFTNITVFENVALVLKQGDVQKVEIATGALLQSEVSAEVEGDRLLLRDTNDCNYFRDYGATTVYVTSPNIAEIRSSTGRTISSDGVLAFQDLSLLSESFINPESETTDGSFVLDLDTQNLRLVVNGIAYFDLSGRTEDLSITIAAGDSRVEAENLIAQNINLNHRGSNDLFINPQQSLIGVIRGTGNVVSYFRPANVDVEILYKGQLLFR